MKTLSKFGKLCLPLLLAVALFGFSRVPALGLGLLVPAYFYPLWWNSTANQWDDLIEAAGQVPLVAIMNPNSGFHWIHDVQMEKGADQFTNTTSTAFFFGYLYFHGSISCPIPNRWIVLFLGIPSLSHPWS